LQSKKKIRKGACNIITSKMFCTEVLLIAFHHTAGVQYAGPFTVINCIFEEKLPKHTFVSLKHQDLLKLSFWPYKSMRHFHFTGVCFSLFAGTRKKED